jgi:triacylglycerol esterase/lipase EstA (alpha/beta hydrolase family)
VTFALAQWWSPRPLRGLVPAFVKELWASLVLLPAWPLYAFLGARYRRALSRHTETGEPLAMPAEGTAPTVRNGPPVILLHGYLMNRTNWLWFGPALARRGVSSMYGYTYRSIASMETSARKLATFIDKVCALEQVEQVDIVAHSLGGLVTRYYIEVLGGTRVRRLVTIGTPHRGTRLARLGHGPVAHELRQDSSVITRLGAPPDGAAYTSVWSRWDNMIIPAESSSLEDTRPLRQDGKGDLVRGEIVFDDLGHLGLLVSPRVANAVAERLSA